jgi:ACR3 family arsenite transporter
MACPRHCGSVLPGWLDLEQTTISTSPWKIAKIRAHLPRHTAAHRLPLPLPRRKTKGRDWRKTRFLPRIGPWALHGLLFAIVDSLGLQGDQITNRPIDMVRIAVPLLAFSRSCGPGRYLPANACMR